MCVCRSHAAQSTFFNVVGFGDRVQSLWQETRAYDADTFRQCDEHLKTVQADLGPPRPLAPALCVCVVSLCMTLLTRAVTGGTNVIAPLEQIFAQPLRPGVPRQIVRRIAV